MRKAYWIVLVVAAALLAMGSYALAAEPAPAEKAAAAPAAPPKPPGVGDAVPEFELPGLDGKALSFAKDIKGKNEVVFIMFMSTACSACQAEVSAVNDLYGRYKDRMGIYVVAVDIRGAETVKPFSETYRYNATYLLDNKFAVPRKFGFAYTPSIVIADKDGKIAFMKGGYDPGDEDMLQTKVSGMLKKK